MLFQLLLRAKDLEVLARAWVWIAVVWFHQQEESSIHSIQYSTIY